MLRSRRTLLLFAVLASLIACSTSGGSLAPAQGPYAQARTSLPVRLQPTLAQDVRVDVRALHETRQMCSLHGNNGAC
jgi:hypothetical protein